MSFFRDGIWQFVGVVISFITLMFSLFFYYFQSKKKQLLYKINSNISLLNIQAFSHTKLHILFGGKPLQNARIIAIEIWNSGKVEILKNDYEHRIKFNFGKNANILEVLVLETKPESIKAHNVDLIQFSRDTVAIKRILFNPKDCIKFQVLLTNFEGTITVTSRINGLEQILSLEQLSSQKSYKMVVIPSLIGTALTYILIFLLRIIIYNLYINYYHNLNNFNILDDSLRIVLLNPILFLLIFIFYFSFSFLILFLENKKLLYYLIPKKHNF